MEADGSLLGDARLKAFLSNLRDFLGGIDVSAERWKEDVEDFCRTSLEPKRERRATFNIDDDDSSADSKIDASRRSEPPVCASVGVQADAGKILEVHPTLERTQEEIEADWKKGMAMVPGDVLRLLRSGKVKQRDIEGRLGDPERSIAVRRAFVARHDLNDPSTIDISALPFAGYDYKYVINQCCENVIGYVPIPVGVAGPIKVNTANPLYVPMATTEGALIASVNRGMAAIMRAGGVAASVYNRGMTRGPVVEFPRATEAVALREWLKAADNYDKVKEKFEGTSGHARLTRVEPIVEGRRVHLRFVATTGDAMGMNMVSKASSSALLHICSQFPRMKVISLSGNACTDKKAAAINWVNGRGHSVVADVVIPGSVVASVLKTTTAALVHCARAKLEGGSAAAGALGGGNAHAANVVAAIFLATGQDAAQVVSSSMCTTTFEEEADGSLYASVTMPCLEIGTLGGGTNLPPQAACLKMLGVAGASPPTCKPGENVATLAQYIAATVLAGELSLMAALTTDDLVRSHMKMNRSRLNLYDSTPSSSMPDLPIHGKITLTVPSGGRRPHAKVECNSIL